MPQTHVAPHDGSNERTHVIEVPENSKVAEIAETVLDSMRKHKCIEIQGVGSSAIKQIIRAEATARTQLNRENIAVISIPHFSEVMHNGQRISALCLYVENIDYGRKQ